MLGARNPTASNEAVTIREPDTSSISQPREVQAIWSRWKAVFRVAVGRARQGRGRYATSEAVTTD
jgi:hypothetical protein